MDDGVRRHALYRTSVETLNMTVTHLYFSRSPVPMLWYAPAILIQPALLSSTTKRLNLARDVHVISNFLLHILLTRKQILNTCFFRHPAPISDLNLNI
jgi:hypothetical protein